jgi:hypothetical protein
MTGDSAADRAELTRLIAEVVGREPGSTAREILAGLPDEVRRGITRREVNSVLYKGVGSTFIRSDDEKPRWRLAVGQAASSPAPAREPAKQSSRHLRPVVETSTPKATAEDAPGARDIARILFDDR